MNETERDEAQQAYDKKMQAAKQIAATAARDCAKAMIEMAEALEDEELEIEEIQNDGEPASVKAQYKTWKRAWAWLLAYRASAS